MLTANMNNDFASLQEQHVTPGCRKEGHEIEFDAARWQEGAAVAQPDTCSCSPWAREAWLAVSRVSEGNTP